MKSLSNRFLGGLEENFNIVPPDPPLSPYYVINTDKGLDTGRFKGYRSPADAVTGIPSTANVAHNIFWDVHSNMHHIPLKIEISYQGEVRMTAEQSSSRNAFEDVAFLLPRIPFATQFASSLYAAIDGDGISFILIREIAVNLTRRVSINFRVNQSTVTFTFSNFIPISYEDSLINNLHQIFDGTDSLLVSSSYLDRLTDFVTNYNVLVLRLVPAGQYLNYRLS